MAHEALFLVVVFVLLGITQAAPSFIIKNDEFVKDGENFQIISGCIHYSRLPRSYWADRLQRMKAMGLNTIETYVFWNFHEADEGAFDFRGRRDLVAFLETAQKLDMLVMLRAGPYSCGEWEFGGFPAWLLNKSPAVRIRTYDEQYIKYVDKWWDSLLPRVKPLLYSNGGPVIMVQVENEYGSYGNVKNSPGDKQYMEHLVSVAREYLGNDVILYTTDGGSVGYMERGSLNGSAVYTVGDFGPGGNPNSSFAAQKQFNPKGMSPSMCSEFYSGWLTHWGERMANTSSSGLAKALDQLLSYGASASLYMGHGGTNFGYWSGANGGGQSFQPTITSYDYDCPISEAGDHGYGSDGLDKYEAVKNVIKKYNKNIPPEPPFVTRVAYGAVKFTQSASMLDNLAALGTRTFSNQAQPKYMEAYNQNYGFILYSSTSTYSGSATLDIENVRDRAHVFVNKKLSGIVYRPEPSKLSLNLQKDDKIDILVENMGRLNYGGGMTDPKGLNAISWSVSKPTSTLTVVTMPTKYNELKNLQWTSAGATNGLPTFYKGTFEISTSSDIHDTFVHTSGWSKGVIWINGNNLGRYWEVKGPQHSLYVPAEFLVSGQNEVIFLELDKSSASLDCNLVDYYDWHYE